MNIKYTFSGHESFPCKSMWLKKGYDFVKRERNFNAPDAVIDLGVGKNMVSSIRFWLKSFGLYDGKDLSELADYLLMKLRAEINIWRIWLRYGCCILRL